MSKEFYPGIGQAVAERTILRKIGDRWETWEEVSRRVALGNTLLSSKNSTKEYEVLQKHISNATILMSGRHLQHGDETQPERTMEVFTNCSTASMSFLEFLLLLSGSGVGRCYDDDMMITDWDNAPSLRCVLSDTHPDYDLSAHESVRDARHKYGNGRGVLWHVVDDSREGWAKALECWEKAAFEKIHKDKMFILDFSKVREKGAPINGMQGRPASGPIPLMNAFNKARSLKGANLDPWLQTMYIDHYFAECVLVGGARRAARMATKTWRDESVIDFITIKRPIEYNGYSLDEIIQYRKDHAAHPYGFLWSSNNSVTVDQEFWDRLEIKRGQPKFNDPLTAHARKVFRKLTQSSYGDGTGEPGIINQHKLVQNNEGWEDLFRGDYVGSKKYQVNMDTQIMLAKLARKAKRKKSNMIVNPCGEIALNMLGGFCVIADVVPYHAETLDEGEEAVRTAVRALIRVNTMDSIYQHEVKRTNRIGVGFTGIQEFAAKHFGYGFYDLIDEEKSMDFWLTLDRYNKAVRDESIKYSKKLGVKIPHTCTTIKPAGTTSKLFGLTEGWHLPSMTRYIRWVQFRNDDPLVEDYRERGYPCRELTQYDGTTIVGFPTSLEINKLIDNPVTASQATPEEQYKWIELGEKYWINGLTDESYGNQISYTLKYDPESVEYKEFKEMMKTHQPNIRCCAVMPMADVSSYEYQPEESVTKAKYEEVCQVIRETVEDVDFEHVGCASGACPVDFNKK